MHDELNMMTADQIIETAKANGYTTYTTASGHLRIGGSKMKYGPDRWMNSANVALWTLESAALAQAEKAIGAAK